MHPTWFIIFFLITTSLVGEFAAQFPDNPYSIHLFVGILASFLFFSSVLFHEMSHSLLARKMGHPVRGITLFVFGGVSEIAEEAHTPSAEFWIAVIGPFSSFFLAGVFFALRFLFEQISVEFAAMSARLAAINLALGIFNLLPAFPLDGGRVLRSLLWKYSANLIKATRISGKVGRFFGYFMIVSGILIGIGSGRFLNGLWIAFIGWFLTNAAEASVNQLEVHTVLEGLRAKDIMAPECPVVSGEMILSELVENFILPSGNRCFLVTDNGSLAGIISMHELKAVPRDRWARTRVRDAMKGLDKLVTASPETSIEKILRTMDDQKINQLPVMDHNRLVGIITRERLLNLVRTRIALKEAEG